MDLSIRLKIAKNEIYQSKLKLTLIISLKTLDLLPRQDQAANIEQTQAEQTNKLPPYITTNCNHT